MIGDIIFQFEFPLNMYTHANTMWGFKFHHLKGRPVYQNENPDSCFCKEPAVNCMITLPLYHELNRRK